ncbi:bifunctional 4-hydroxy-2-oxoglutarate aldolase/2-dehydro-3-deoxy-phosphogluconate aldolase [Halobacteria archaeon AArc-m2/3/4]|uniref:Bifunctional 4-hydroxy-2-oxoglutarate aldolase/2-dehydro-3-deoxy-phosphogluconate aldolase n=1 Tax=Natronoglomus mannanivorans TaxID=2979990 RepID=A0ABT2QAT1_9EURY|nr:bifunctional 4-hydroxy-2-oxoglutarate aldolase/2-dehydro-3-deoxy-phosphogluconate aldolase [Halobacteria archaeon AArc-m2/3/4]
MADKLETYQQIVDAGVVAVMRGIDEEDIVPVAKALYEGGVVALEVTADATRATDMIADVDRALEDTDAVVGAGTVLDESMAVNVIEAGADYILAPHFDEGMVTACNRYGKVSIPGVATPTEAVEAAEAGADMLKVFPASDLGPGYISAIQGPLGQLPIVATGGVSPDNVNEFFDAGSTAVGAGSAMIDYDAIERGDMDGVREHAERFVEAVENARS